MSGVQIPTWIQIFVLAGIGLVILAVPLRVFWGATRKTRERLRRSGDFVERLRERFSDVKSHPGILGPATVSFTHRDRKVVASLPSEKTLVVRLDDPSRASLPIVLCTNSGLRTPWTLAGLRFLPRIHTADPLIDEGIAVYASPVLGAFLMDLIARPEEAAGGEGSIAESLVVLRKLPGVKSFRLVAGPDHPTTIRLRLRAEDMIHRPDELESLVHHLQALHDRLGAFS